MADSNFRGPVNSMGALEVDAATAAVQPLDGPSMFYQGDAMPDIRSAPFAKDGFRPGQQPAFLRSGMVLLDQIPQKNSSTVVAAGQVVTAAVAVSLVTTQPTGVASAAGIAVGVPIVPIGTSVVTYAALALDFGFTTGSTAVNSTTAHVVDNSMFRIGAWYVIGGAANASASRSLLAQVVAIHSTNGTGITLNTTAGTTLVTVPIGQANLIGGNEIALGTQFGPATASANAHSYGGGFGAGLARAYNPREMLSRNIQVQGVTAIQNAYSAVVSGWDVWGNPMTEVLSAAAGVTTFVGKKAFKYISSITSGTTVANSQNVSFGIGDTFGLPVRVDYWEQLFATWNGVVMSNFSGFVGPYGIGTTIATSGSPAAAPTAYTPIDVRGTLTVSTAVLTGSLATAMSVIATNGTGRLFVAANIPPMQNVFATPINQVPMFGISQYTATS